MTKFFVMGYPEIGYPMTDALLCIGCINQLEGIGSGRPPRKEERVSRISRYCDCCRMLLIEGSHTASTRTRSSP